MEEIRSLKSAIDLQLALSRVSVWFKVSFHVLLTDTTSLIGQFMGTLNPVLDYRAKLRFYFSAIEDIFWSGGSKVSQINNLIYFEAIILLK